MFNLSELLFELKPLAKQVKLYTTWKAVRYPSIARMHRDVLYEFFRYYRVPCATLITVEKIEAFALSQNSIHFQNQARNVLKQFCRYWYKLGLLTEQFSNNIKKDTIRDMEDVHPLLHVDQVIRVKALRDEGLSYREIKTKMQAEDQRNYDLHAVYRWANYELPELSTSV